MHLIIFDIDGTLTDSTEYDAKLYIQAVNDVLGVEINDTWEQYLHSTDSGILDEIIDINSIEGERGRLHNKVKKKFIDYIHKYLSDNSHIVNEIPGAKRFLEELSTYDSVIIAIATGGWEETARMKLKSIGINSEDYIIATSSDAISRKEIIMIAEKKALSGRISAQKTYIGDGVWDKKASEELDYNFIAIGNKVDHKIKFDDFRSNEEIYKILGI
jgi:phosphoglycolate phosphatase-like HAD superfamily hydrolase